MDEFGVTLVSPHLLSKGVAFHLSCKVFEQITGKSQSLLMTVISNWVETDNAGEAGSGERYGAFAEFDPADTNLKTQVRTWVTKNRSS